MAAGDAAEFLAATARYNRFKLEFMGRITAPLFCFQFCPPRSACASAWRTAAINSSEDLDGDGVEGKTNYRNGYSKKSVLTGTSKMTLSVPRDRAGTFDPKLIAKYRRRFPEFDDKIISMYARRMTVREIRGHLEELYSIDVSPDLISAITDAVLDEAAEWQNRPLDLCYPLVLFDAIRV